MSCDIAVPLFEQITHLLFKQRPDKLVSLTCLYRYTHRILSAPVAQSVECPLRGTGGHAFDPGPRHTKVVKNGTSCSSLGTPTYRVELGLVDPVSG